MKTDRKIARQHRTALLDACVILALSATVGVAWNYQLLHRAWHGEVTVAAAPSPPPTVGSAAEAGPEAMPVGLPQAKELFDAKGAVFVDARDPGTFKAGHLKGAVSIPLEKAKTDGGGGLGKWPADAVIITYCNGFSCHDSMELGKILIKAGYSNVYVYEGGFPEWRDAGYPVEAGS